MLNQKNTFFQNFFISGHLFNKDEILLKFQFKIINTVLLSMVIFYFFFALLSSLNVSPLGQIPTITNYVLAFIAALLISRLRVSKTFYTQVSYFLYGSAFVSFVIMLLFIPHDEFRLIWFYLLVIAAYIIGGVRTGNFIAALSIITIITISALFELQLSWVAINTAIFSLIIMSFFIRAYTKRIIDFEQEIIKQQDYMISQSRLAAMGEMMSMIAHQWRQPLSTTTLMIADKKLHLMLQDKKSHDEIDILDKISDTLLYLSETIDDFQTYFKPEKSTQVILLSKLMSRLVQLSESRLKIAEVTMNIGDAYQDEKIDIFVNEMLQVLINIINNSIDVMLERKVKGRQIWISLDVQDKKLLIRIEDNAGGVQEDVIEKIFEPYFSTKSKNGTGLGLYMSKMIVDRHIGGEIKVQNTGKGALFTITLPIPDNPF